MGVLNFCIGVTPSPTLRLPHRKCCFLFLRLPLFRFLRSTNTHVANNVGDAASAAFNITDSCFTPESDPPLFSSEPVESETDVQSESDVNVQSDSDVESESNRLPLCSDN